MAQIDFNHAKIEFENYLSAFDLNNPKIQLKKVHTYGVVKAADYIGRREGLKQEDRDLALLIALLHDIGRFEQLKVFNSYDDNQFDHARFGVKLLLRNHLSGYSLSFPVQAAGNRGSFGAFAM